MPYCPETRQYRTFAASNFQPVTRDMDDPEDDKDSRVVRGMFTTFNQWYELMPGFFERIDPHALDETDMSDTIMQFDHQGPVLARNRNGSLRVGIEPDGGWCEADLSGCQQARDLYESIQNGLVDEMSFGFSIGDDGFEWEEDEDGTIRSTITKISRLYDVSAVSIPANPNTSISARSYVDAAIEAERKAKELAAESEEPADEPADEPAEESEATGEPIEQPSEEQLRARRMRRARAMRLSSI